MTSLSLARLSYLSPGEGEKMSLPWWITIYCGPLLWGVKSLMYWYI
jgi:hypothetical protein